MRLEALDRPDTYVTHTDAHVALADPLRIETSQFRLRDGRGSTSFEALDAPGLFLSVGADGVVFAGSSAARFVRRPGLADPRGTSWQVAGARRSFLMHDGDALRVGVVGDRRATSATFFVR